MRSFSRLLATTSSSSPTSLLSSRPLALLPPIPLYRRILRAHRKILPPDARTLGDAYVKAEFRAHREIDNPKHIIGFLSEWQVYVQQIEGDGWRGAKLDKMKLDKMSDEQVGQLYELMQAIQKIDDSGEEGGGGGPTGNKP